MKISACLIAKNEEKNIARCINSFKKVVNEIILVDTGSEDDTKKIAAGLGAKVYDYPWDGSFSNARNYALDRAKGDWIIFLDADEYFADGTGSNIPAILRQIHHNKNFNGVLCKVYHLDQDHAGRIKNVDSLLRIFRNSKKVRYVGTIHEYVYIDGQAITPAIISENLLKIYHTGYSSGIFIGKLERNLELLLKDQKNGTDNVMTNYYLAETYNGLGKYELSIKHARAYLETENRPPLFDVNPHLQIINSMFKLDKPQDEILAEINKTIEKFPRHPDFHRLLGMYYFNAKQYRRAAETYEKAFSLSEKYNDIQINTFSGNLPQVYLHLGMIALYRNDHVGAMELFFKSLQAGKYVTESFNALMQVIKGEKSDDIILFLKGIYDEQNEQDLAFLVHHLAQLKMTMPLLYFHKRWKNQFGHMSSSTIFLFLLAGRHREAFEHFATFYKERDNKWVEPFVVISSLLSNNEEDIRTARELVGASYKKLMDTYDTDKKIELGPEDKEAYLTLLKEFILLDSVEQVQHLLNLKDKFEADLSLDIGDVFFDQMFFNLAAEQYEVAVLKGTSDKAVAYFRWGLSLYKMLKYKEATDLFYAALEHGYSENDIHEYLYWISEKS